MNHPSHLLALLLVAFSGSIHADAVPTSEWAFRVSLDDTEIGRQYFRLHDGDGLVRLETRAEFAVKFLLATVYRYEHTNVETWDGECLAGIESRTDANGEPFFVLGERKDGFFSVSGTAGEARLPECVMSFAYWNPRFLQSSRLLNTQNGEYVEISVSEPTRDRRIVRGEQIEALRYRLQAGEIDMQIWYSLDDRWLGLESKTQGDRTLRYELM
jgi:hypothetical protein